MKRSVILIYSFIIIILAAATIVERLWGTPVASGYIYSAAWFHTLWGILSLCGLWIMYKVRMWRTARPAMLLHTSFVVILCGALITSLFATEKTIHLREGDSDSKSLPFTLTLKQFELKTYAGTGAPQDYVSHIQYKDGTESGSYSISMNNVFRHRGYRLYQTSYDDDCHGTLLTARHDPYGIAVTYTGYILLLVSMLWMLADRRGIFRRLLRECVAKGLLTIVMCLAFATANAAHNAPTPHAISQEKASALARKQVVYNGRIVPIRTLALDFCQKVTGRRSFGGLSAERFMLSVMLYPDDWKAVKMIKIEDEALRSALGIESSHGAMNNFFESNGNYRMRPLYLKHKGTDDPMERAILKVDERCSLIVMLISGELVSAVPPEAERPSEFAVNAELLYDAAPWSLILFIASFVIAVVSIVLLFVRHPAILSVTLNALTATLFLLLTCLYILRWIIQEHIPLSNGYETMLFIALIASLFAALSAMRHIRHVGLLTVMALLVSAFALLVSHLSFMSPEMTPLMPVLQSPLLSAHVSTVMISYALFAILTLLSTCALIASSRRTDLTQKLTLVCQLLLYPAVFLLGIGIFLGAVWANVSWGTYWSWDPKETWALITFMVYAAPMHRASISSFQKARTYHIYIVCAFITVLATYFGVNYILGGMHSYA